MNKRRHRENDEDEEAHKKSIVEQTTGQGFSRVVQQHYNQLEERGKDARFQSKILFLRNCNNWIKSILIRE